MNGQIKLILFALTYACAVCSFVYGFIPLALFIILTALLLLKFRFKIISAGFAGVIILIFIAGLFNTSLNLKYDDELTSYSDNDVIVEAVVKTIPANNLKNKTKFFAKVVSVQTIGADKTNIDAKTFVTVIDDEEKLKNIKIGDRISLRGRVKSVAPPANPYQFNYARYLQYKKAFSVMYCESAPEIIAHDETPVGRIIRKLNDKRSEIINIHAQNIKSPMLEILGGIIFGDDAVNPDEDTKKSFINSGIFHILAASGMNVTLIFGIWFFIASRLRFHYCFSIVSGMLLILFYTCMTGFGPPVVRAYLMLTFILAGKLFNRKTSTITLLFIVGFLMLLHNPLLLFDIGFQLSFIVTFALILTAPLVAPNTKFKWLNGAAAACTVPIIAQLYAFPLQMFYFNTFSMYSVFANIAIIPVLSFVSFVGFVASIIALIPSIAQKVCAFADIMLNPLLVYIVKVANFFSALPNSIIYLPKIGLITLFLYFAVIISLTLIEKFKFYNRKALISLGILTALMFLSLIKLPSHKTEIIFFSVGNADAALIKTPDNKYFLSDTGKSGYMNSPAQAANIIIPYLRNSGVKELEAIILSHFDADHAGGTVDILETFPVKTVYFSDGYEDTELHKTIEDYILNRNINYKTVINPLVIMKTDDTEITVMRPEGVNLKTENQKSLVTHLKSGDFKALFAGDGDITSYALLDDKYKKNVSVMKSGHHGAKDTVNREMAKNTELFVISTGYNIYGHPDSSVLETIEAEGRQYLRTDYHNAIKITADKSGTEIMLFSPARSGFVKYSR